MTPERVYQDIAEERTRQQRLLSEGKFSFTCADTGIADPSKLAVLAEEFGEVAREVCEMSIALARQYPGEDPALVVECKARTVARLRVKLYKELVQVAAVCVAWCEAISLPSEKTAEPPGCWHAVGDIAAAPGHACGEFVATQYVAGHLQRSYCEKECGHSGPHRGGDWHSGGGFVYER